jgi:hypothetical protein
MRRITKKETAPLDVTRTPKSPKSFVVSQMRSRLGSAGTSLLPNLMDCRSLSVIRVFIWDSAETLGQRLA